MIKSFTKILLASVVMISGLSFGGQAFASDSTSGKSSSKSGKSSSKSSVKVVVCHATGSVSNPYNRIEVDENSTRLAGHNPSHHTRDIISPAGGVCPSGVAVVTAGPCDALIAAKSEKAGKEGKGAKSGKSGAKSGKSAAKASKDKSKAKYDKAKAAKVSYEAAGTPCPSVSATPSATATPVSGIAGFGVEVQSWQEVPAPAPSAIAG